jgi:hypothetical protein
MSTQIITYQGQEIVYTDYKMKSPEEMLIVLEESIVFAKRIEAKGEQYLYLVDLTNVPITKEFGEKLMEGGKSHVNNVKRSAILGITGIKRMFFESYLFFSKSNMHSFQDKIKALNYLVSI